MKMMLLRSAVCAVLLTQVMAVPTAHADENGDETFVSLTRRPTKMKNLPTNTTIITADDIRLSGAKSMADVMELIPSANPQRTGSLGTFTNLRMRGVPASSQVQVVIDDQPLGGVSHQFIDLEQIPIQNIERVEVVRGGSSVLYGANTIGGVVHIITKKNISQPSTASFGFQGGSFQTKMLDAAVGGSHNGWNALMTASKYTTDGFMENSDADNTTFTETFGYSFGNGARLSMDIAHVRHDVGSNQGTAVPIEQWDGEKERVAEDKTTRVEQKKTESRLKGSVPLGGAGVAESVFYGSRQHYLTRPDGDAPADFEQKNNIMGNDTRFMFFDGTTVGASYERDERYNVGDDRLHITNVGGYLQHDFITSGFSFLPAVRFDHHSNFGSIVNPRLTAVYDISSRWSVSGNIARSYRAPSFLELFFKSSTFNGNPDLEPEKGWTYDLGNRFQLTRRHQLKVTGYFSKISDRIAATATTYENLNKAEMFGVETELKGTCYEGVIGRVSESLAYAYQHAQASSTGSSEFFPLRLTPTHTITAQVEWRKDGWNLNNLIKYVSDQFQFDNYGGGRLPPYAVWNARLSKTIKVMELFTEVDNITDRRYADAFDFSLSSFSTTLDPQPPRTYWGGIKINFQGASDN